MSAFFFGDWKKIEEAQKAKASVVPAPKPKKVPKTPITCILCREERNLPNGFRNSDRTEWKCSDIGMECVVDV